MHPLGSVAVLMDELQVRGGASEMGVPFHSVFLFFYVEVEFTYQEICPSTCTLQRTHTSAGIISLIAELFPHPKSKPEPISRPSRSPMPPPQETQWPRLSRFVYSEHFV